MRKFLFINRILFSALLLAIILNNCGTTSMYMKVKRPAEINLKGYQKVAIGDIVNARNRVDQHSKDLADELTSTLFKSGHFEVLDRQHLRKILEEHSLNQSGLIDESTAPEIGKLIGAAVLVFGRIQNDKYEEKTSHDEPKKDKKGKVTQKFYRNGEYNLSSNVKVIDIQTAKILAVKTLTARQTNRTSAINKNAPPIDKNSLYRRCLNDIGAQFLRVVSPYETRVKASFETDDAYPEVDQAITMFKIGEWDDGLKLLQSATEKTSLEKEVRAKSFYNLGLAQTYSGDFDEAIKNLKKALMLNPDSSRYQSAIMNTKAEKEKAEKLKEQL
jgi:curli biogenesis system outer membrane secretion channel CsgG